MRFMLLLAVLTALAPVASAGGPVHTLCETEEFMFGWRTACDEAGDPTRAVEVLTCAATSSPCEPAADIELAESYGTFYVSIAPPGVFHESNGCAGFQATAETCGAADRRATIMDLSPLWPYNDPATITVPRIVCAGESIATGEAVACALLTDDDGAYQNAGCVARRTLIGGADPCGVYAAAPYEDTWIYVGAGPWGLYVESNGCEGLQQVASDCDGDGELEPRDRALRPSDVGL